MERDLSIYTELAKTIAKLKKTKNSGLVYQNCPVRVLLHSIHACEVSEVIALLQSLAQKKTQR